MKHVKLFEDYNLSEKKITLAWNDDDNAIVFSDGEIASVDYDGDFQYRGEWFSTVDHTEADDLIRDLEKRFKRDRFEWIGESFINNDNADDIKVNESAADVDKSYDKILNLLQKETRRLNDDDAYELHEKLKAYFNRLF